MTAPPRPRIDPLYPDDDGLPMSDNTLQFEWIVLIKDNLEALFKDRPDVFVAGNLLWYAVEGEPKIRTAPDALVVFGRPKGYRGSYKQWEEENIPPQVVFEVLSPGNRARDLIDKFHFYERFGVEEYYLFNPELMTLDGWIRRGDHLEVIPETNGWTSPLLGIRFILAAKDMTILRPDGNPFQSYVQAERRIEEAKRELDEEREIAREQRERAERLAARLRELGIDPEA